MLEIISKIQTTASLPLQHVACAINVVFLQIKSVYSIKEWGFMAYLLGLLPPLPLHNFCFNCLLTNGIILSFSLMDCCFLQM